MANIETVISAAATNTQAEDTAQNPTQANGAAGTQTVHVTLRFRGVDFDPNVLYDALDAGYTTVASVKGTLARGTYIFDITT